MENILRLIVIFLWFLGTIGGVGYALYNGSSYPIAAGCLINGLLAFPFIKEQFDKMQE